MKRLLIPILLLALASCARVPSRLTLGEGDSWTSHGNYTDFELNAQVRCSEGAEALLRICQADGIPGQAGDDVQADTSVMAGIDRPSHGYAILLHNGPIDGSVKTGSLLHVRNLYRSQASDGEWFDLNVAVRGRNIGVRVDGTDVVCYTEPEAPWRAPGHEKERIAPGRIGFEGQKGTVEVRNLTVTPLPEGVKNPADTLPPVDEQKDGIIRLQQRDFPVIDYHVHLKGGLTQETAHAMSMNYGINYGVAPNAGEGGVGRMLADDAEVRSYYDELSGEPFLFGVQGEGRKWTQTFSKEALGLFEYLFTDAMTIIDHKGRNSRIYRPEEVHFDGIGKQQYMDHLVDQTVLILTNEPADIYANPTFLPHVLQAEYDALWTPERIDKVLDVLEKYHIALEINPRYRIPSFDIIRRAKARGIKFTFGTNNADADFGRLEYALEAIEACGLTAGDIWFPSMSIRADRPTVIYNHFD